jgi:Flp pilus assembly protein TadD
LSGDDLAVALQHHRDGRLAAAVEVYERLLARDAGNPEVHRCLGVARLQQGDLPAAERLLSRAAGLAPGSLQVTSDLGALRLAQRRYRDAAKLLEEVLRREPDHADALNHCAIAWTEMGHLERAEPMFERLTRLRPASSAAFRQLGDTQHRLGRNEAATAALQRALELDPDDRQSRLALGDIHESLGRSREARAQYVALLRRHPGSPLALARLLMLSGQEPDPDWVVQAARIAGSGDVPPELRARVSIALAHHHDRLGLYDEAFRHLERGNLLLRQQRPYDAARFAAAVDRLIEVFTPAQIETLRSRHSNESDRPLFIVGMPRSGTTLLEQMLAAHSRVEAGGEMSAMLNVAARVRQLDPSRRDYPHGVRDLGARELASLAQYYLSRLERVSATAARVTDKLPFNFMHVGLIAALFPRAAIVHCRRDPLDTCVSCLFTGFTEQIRFANDMGTLGQYYRHYQRLMRHWREAVPERMLDVQYEELVTGTEPVLRATVAHCGLDWEPSCLEFHVSQRSVRTPSRWQVRRPVSTAAVGRWKNYEPWIGPLRESLATDAQPKTSGEK